MGIASDFIVIVVIALVAALIAQRLKQPVIVGYIVAGILVGPFTSWFTISNVEDIRNLADLGVALLLFAIGLEFSLKDLKVVREVALIGTSIQILVTILLGMGLGQLLDFDWITSVWFGAILAPSGTLVVLKTLSSRGLIGTLSSRVIIGTLIVQDILSIPLMLILPALNDLSTGLSSLGFAAIRGAIFLAGMIFVGTRLIPALMNIVVRWNSRELFILTITALGLGVGYITQSFGLSMAFGAFVVGIVLSESDYSYQALSDIIPLRDLFGMLFFVSVGMLLDPRFLIENFNLVLITVISVVLIKSIVLGVITRFFGYGNIIPLAVGLTMFQLGEFSFVLAQVGLSTNSINTDLYSLVLSTAIITTVLTPFISKAATPIYRLQQRYFQREALQTVHLSEDSLGNHVVVAGGGTVGYYIARVLQNMAFPFVVVEYDSHRLERLKADRIPTIYGDVSQETVLQTAQVSSSCLFLLTVPEITKARETIQQVKRLAPSLHIIARADEYDHISTLSEAGVYEVVQPEFEASLEIVRQAMLHLEVPPHEVMRFTDEIRQEISTQSPKIDYQRFHKLRRVSTELMELTWIDLPEENTLASQSIKDLRVRQQTGASIVGILRGSAVISNPAPEHQLQDGDTIAVLGNQHQVEQVRQLLFDASDRLTSIETNE